MMKWHSLNISAVGAHIFYMYTVLDEWLLSYGLSDLYRGSWSLLKYMYACNKCVSV